jgi:epoxide hydrolase
MPTIRFTVGVTLLLALFLIGSGPATGIAAQGQVAIVPFKIAVPDPVLTDLKDRLARTRFPSEIENSGWEYGTNLGYLRELVTYWRTKFDWRAQERQLNLLPQFKTSIDGLDLHFVHKKSSRTDAVPLVFVHGWPGSIVEVTKIIGPLTEPPPGEVAFHVVAISLPGYGFSDKPKQAGVSNRRIAGMIAQLMARLGYQRYGAQGGDWGGFIVRQLGLVDPQHLIGVHSNMCVAGPAPGSDSNAAVPPDELKRLEAMRQRSANESAYSQLQGTKPQTLGYSLNDSPAGLAAWIVEKFRTWSDSGGTVEKKFTKDELLTNITIYWVTETGPSSVRLYYENRIDPGLQGKVTVPFACAVFPFEMFIMPPRQWVEASYNLQQYTVMPRGGHFAAMEEPELLVADMRKFFSRLK